MAEPPAAFGPLIIETDLTAGAHGSGLVIEGAELVNLGQCRCGKSQKLKACRSIESIGVVLEQD
ncbi:MAG: hypothetical protein LBG74_02830 [Spirochaetaceae bacterium]|nr:hypothetical protein [Spirochaetaceae bacterium]